MNTQDKLLHIKKLQLWLKAGQDQGLVGKRLNNAITKEMDAIANSMDKALAAKFLKAHQGLTLVTAITSCSKADIMKFCQYGGLN